jgi:hypothetical protein
MDAELLECGGPRSPLYGRLFNDANVSGTPSCRTEPMTAPPAAIAEWTPSFLECGARGAALRRPSQRRQRFRHAFAAPSQPPPRQRLLAEWTLSFLECGARGGHFTDACSSDANVSGTARAPPRANATLVRRVDPRRERKRRLKSPHSKGPLPPRQRLPLNGRRAFGVRRLGGRFTDASQATPTFPARLRAAPNQMTVDPEVARAASESGA